MKLFGSLISLMTTFFALTAHADELPDGYLVSRRTSQVTVFSVDSVSITHQDIGTSGTFTKVSGVVDLTLSVEGNLCLSKPEDVAIVTSPTRSMNRMNLSLISTYTYDPYSTVVLGCTAITVPRTAKVAIPVQSYVRNAEVFSTVFVVALDPNNNPGQKSEVKVTFSKADGFKAVIQ